MRKTLTIATIAIACLIGCGTPKKIETSVSNTLSSPIKYDNIEILLKKMTLDEKIGQMNQYSGFWDVTGPSPKEGDAAQKYENIRAGLVGSMLNVRGVEQVRKVQKIAVDETRLARRHVR